VKSAYNLEDTKGQAAHYSRFSKQVCEPGQEEDDKKACRDDGQEYLFEFETEVKGAPAPLDHGTKRVVVGALAWAHSSSEEPDLGREMANVVLDRLEDGDDGMRLGGFL